MYSDILNIPDFQIRSPGFQFVNERSIYRVEIHSFHGFPTFAADSTGVG